MAEKFEGQFECLGENTRKYIKSYLDYMITKVDQKIFRCFECKKNYKAVFNKQLIKRFAIKFCNKNNRFILLLRKGICLYEYIHSWKRFDEIFFSIVVVIMFYKLTIRH